ncbi:hypothetical protein BJ138DRAFT_1013307, partial [Hygrophoropsis aurantiaca]
LVHPTSFRYNPTHSPTTSGRPFNHSDDEKVPAPRLLRFWLIDEGSDTEAGIETEQRDGYAKLKDVFPVSEQRTSKASLLKRGRGNSSPLLLRATQADCRIPFRARLLVPELEVQRLRGINERVFPGSSYSPSSG